LVALEKEVETRKRQSKLKLYTPYSKQRDFHAAGADHRERLLMAANQVGKTWSAGMEVACHATGQYPDWWTGRRFDKETVGWCAGITGESTRDNVQRILLGRPGQFGTGAIPKTAIIEHSSSRGVADLVDTIKVRHINGEISTIGLKSYSSGREKWQGETLDYVWFDEEPDSDIYIEGLTRTNATGGCVFLTFTPLLGMSNVVRRFLIEKVPGTHMTQMTIDDAEHYSITQKNAIIASYPAFERDARTKGIPALGSGRVFALSSDSVACQSFAIPDHWPQICGLDFGWDHPSAGVRMAWDRDSDVLYVIATHRAREQTPAQFAGAVRPWGAWLRWAWPHDGLQHDKGSGEQLMAQYRTQGLAMLANRATFEDGSSGLEAGISEMLDRLLTGRLKVFVHLSDWFEEFNVYHRKDGLIVKENDDLLSATRYAMMMKRFAQTKIQKKSPHNVMNAPQPQGWMS
jgi:phage terminase large subunit-like protein